MLTTGPHPGRHQRHRYRRLQSQPQSWVRRLHVPQPPVPPLPTGGHGCTCHLRAYIYYAYIITYKLLAYNADRMPHMGHPIISIIIK